jgi:8-oxo-dGTP pyrophosphatase MutT (NUDIX family)
VSRADTAADGPVDELLAVLAEHEPRDPVEARSLVRTRSLVAWLADPFSEVADPTHVTGSAIVLDGGGRVLLHRHKRLGLWLQPGGHLDPGETPAEAAVREAAEETGLDAVHPDGGPRLIHVDVHEGPRGHVHLDLRYLLSTTGDVELRPRPNESQDVAWLEVADAASRADPSLRSALARLLPG